MGPGKGGNAIVLATFVLAGLGVSACGWLGKSAGVIVRSERAQGPGGGATDTVQAGTLAIGTQMTTELAANLVQPPASLTTDQANLIAAGAQADVAAVAPTVPAGTVAVSTSLQDAALTDTDRHPIHYAAPAVVSGAFKVLDDPRVGLTGDDNQARRVAVAKGIMASTFGSLGGRVQGFDQPTLLGLHGSMLTSAIRHLTDGDLAGDKAMDALQAVTSGAASALRASVGADDAAVLSAAANIAAVSVSLIKTAAVVDQSVGEAAGSCASGVIVGLAGAGLTPAVLAGSTGATAVVAAAAGALKSAVTDPTLVGAHMDDVGAVAMTALAQLGGASVADKTKIMTAIFAGVGTGMKAAGLDATTIVAATASMSEKATAALTSDGFDATSAPTAAGALVAASVECVADANTATVDYTAVTQAMGAAVGKGAEQGGITVDTTTMLQSVSQMMTAASPSTSMVTILKAAVAGVIVGAQQATPAGGTNAVAAAINTALSSSGVMSGVAGVDGGSVVSTLQQAAGAAVAVGASTSAGDCGTVFPDTAGVTSLITAVAAAAQPVTCGTASTTCPKNRSATVDDPAFTWTLAAPGTCALDLAPNPATAPAKASVTPCSTIAAVSPLTFAGVQKYAFSDGSIMCSKAPADSCPAVPANTPDDPSSGFPKPAWVMIDTWGASGDSCYLGGPHQGNNDWACEMQLGGVPACASGSMTLANTQVLKPDSCGRHGQQSSFLCDSPAGSGCPVVDGAVALGVAPTAASGLAAMLSLNSLGTTASGGTRCLYSGLVSCANQAIDPNSTAITASTAAPAAESGFGDFQCLVSGASSTACPPVDATLSYTSTCFGGSGCSSNGPTLPAGDVLCQYTRSYPSCGTTLPITSGLSAAIINNAMKQAVNDPTVWACQMTSPQAVTATLSSDLINLGFETPTASGTPGTTRMTIKTNQMACPTGGNQLSSLPFLNSVFGYACDLTSGSCPAPDPSVSGYTQQQASMTLVPGTTRCFYLAPLSSCPSGNIAPTNLPGLTPSPFPQSNNRYFACDAGASNPCPSTSALTVTGLSSDNGYQAATPIVAGDHRCVVSTNVPLCSNAVQSCTNGAAAGSGITSTCQLGQLRGGLYACDLAQTTGTCPSTSVSAFGAMDGPVAGSEFGRCYLEPTACPSSSITSITGLTQDTNGGNGAVYCSMTTSTCPTMYAVGFNQGASTAISSGNFLCTYSPSGT